MSLPLPPFSLSRSSSRLARRETRALLRVFKAAAAPAKGGFNASKHPRWPAGHPCGGQFRPKIGVGANGQDLFMPVFNGTPKTIQSYEQVLTTIAADLAQGKPDTALKILHHEVATNTFNQKKLKSSVEELVAGAVAGGLKPDDAIRQDLPYAKDDPGFRPETLRQINHPGDLGDLDVVAGIVGDFVQTISHDLAHLNAQLSMDDHIQRHTQIAQCFANYWNGENPDYAPTRWHQDGACLKFWQDQAGITAKTPCAGAFCLFVQLLQELYRITDQLVAEKITDQDAYRQTAHMMEYVVCALTGLDLTEYQP